ncbi:DMT family transporter [Dongia sp.]|uniref:DMT family transporter n=1 Tax=Dongia sp. TaxID=1977262 RepID=UPI0035B18C1A
MSLPLATDPAALLGARWQRHLGILFVLGAALAWSSAGFFTRVVHTDLWTMLVWRGGLGSVALFVFMTLRDGRDGWRAIRAAKAPYWIAVVLTAFAMLVFIAALSLTSVAKVSLIYAAVPFAAACLAYVMLGERPSPAALLASLIAAIGIAIMMAPSFAAGSTGAFDHTLSGDALALLMTLLMALITVHVRRWPDLPMVSVGACACLLTALMALPFATPLSVSAHDVIWLSLFGPITSGIGFVLYAKGAQRLAASEAALLGAVETPLGPLWVWLIFGEVPTAATLLGGALIFITLLVYVWRESAREHSL